MRERERMNNARMIEYFFHLHRNHIGGGERDIGKYEKYIM